MRTAVRFVLEAHDTNTPEDFYNQAEESPQLGVRSRRFAKAAYHKMLAIAEEVGVPLSDDEVIDSANCYRAAEALADDVESSGYYSRASCHLGEAVRRYARNLNKRADEPKG